MQILHISAECYPAAKAGGLGDVAGALPKYLNRHGHKTQVVIPKYQTDWILSQKTSKVFEGGAPYGMSEFSFRIEKVEGAGLGFDLFLADIPGRFDREGVYADPRSGYAFWDEMDRSFTFQIAVLEWLVHLKKLPDIVHVHDHHTALAPFMMSRCFRYEKLRTIPNVLTIHNGEYQGIYDREAYLRLPAFNLQQLGILDWDGRFNALAAGIKCAWQVTTVSEGYLGELEKNCHGLEHLLRAEKAKTSGLINGIDVEVWDPATDPLLEKNYNIRSAKSGKEANKKMLCEEFGLNSEKPLFSFIGRLVREKGADLLPKLIQNCSKEELPLNLLILGTGDPELHKQLIELKEKFVGYFNTRLEYNESLAHTIYAGSDFLIMPSRVEPCGLNQMYAMRYGTVPIVRATGGLADTVIDISQPDGYGFTFDELSVDAALTSIRQAIALYEKKKPFSDNRRKIMKLDFSWENAARRYETLYNQLINGDEI
ncbi:MAG: glycogen/starch synthase [Balneolaceae bacterium]